MRHSPAIVANDRHAKRSTAHCGHRRHEASWRSARPDLRCNGRVPRRLRRSAAPSVTRRRCRRRCPRRRRHCRRRCPEAPRRRRHWRHRGGCARRDGRRARAGRSIARRPPLAARSGSCRHGRRPASSALRDDARAEYLPSSPNCVPIAACHGNTRSKTAHTNSHPSTCARARARVSVCAPTPDRQCAFSTRRAAPTPPPPRR